MNSTLIKFAIIIILSSCGSSDKSTEIDYTDFVEKNVQLVGRDSNYDLKDSLAIVSIKIPERLDTFYHWEHVSDCSSCGWVKYRFADKKYFQFAESGFYWTVIPDSTYQLNIWHKPIKEAPDTVTLKLLSKKDTSEWYYIPHLVSFEKQSRVLLKDFKLINGRPFIIAAFISSYGYLTQTQTLFVIAETTLKSRNLYFIGECGAKDTTGFINNMYKSFLSIRIEEKQ